MRQLNQKHAACRQFIDKMSTKHEAHMQNKQYDKQSKELKISQLTMLTVNILSFHRFFV